LQKIFFGFQNLEKIFLQSGLKFERKISEKRYQIQIKKQKIFSLCKQNIENYRNKINFLSEKIYYLNPETILKRGYSIAYDKDGNIIKNFKELQVGDELSVRVSDALIKTEIKKISAD
jgi:exodeoxyribonuclease VII large subunit